MLLLSHMTLRDSKTSSWLFHVCCFVVLCTFIFILFIQGKYIISELINDFGGIKVLSSSSSVKVSEEAGEHLDELKTINSEKLDGEAAAHWTHVKSQKFGLRRRTIKYR